MCIYRLLNLVSYSEFVPLNLLLQTINGTVALFVFKQKTADDMRISDWSSDVCSSDLATAWAVAANASPVPRRSPRWPGSSPKIGRASSRERGCQYVSIPAVAVALPIPHHDKRHSNQPRLLNVA